MKWWAWCLVALLVVACVLGLVLALVLTRHPDAQPSPIPTTTIHPFPSLTITPSYNVITLLHDTFQGPASLPLPQHAPNAPIGIYWVPYVAFPELPLKLTGAGAASNLINTSTSPGVLIWVGTNITSGQFTNLGYNPVTDVLQMDVTVAALPTITPRPPGNETLLLFFTLARTVPQNDIIALAFEYRLGQATSNPPSWSLGASTNYDVNGVNFKSQTIVDTGFVTGDPPLDTPLHFTLSVAPDGQCRVVCPELGVEATGPLQPDIVPREGFALHALSLYVAATQETSTGAQPLQVPISDVLVTATYPLTAGNALAAPTARTTSNEAPSSPPSDRILPTTVLPPELQHRLLQLGLTPVT